MSVQTVFEHVTKVFPINKPFNPHGIPQELKVLPRWVLWSLVTTSKSKPNAKPSKRPVRISNNNPYEIGIDIAKWATADRQYTFDECFDVFIDNQDVISGLGFIPNPDDGVIFIDYDRCFPLNDDDPRTAWLEQLSQETFIEVSQSGNGAHIVVYGALKERLNDSAKSGIELYPGRKQSFMALTGDVYNNAPLTIAHNQVAIDSHIVLITGNKPKEERSTFVLPDEIPEGGRNNTLIQYCGYLISKGGTKEAVLTAMLTMNVERCKPPEDVEVIISMVDRLFTKEAERKKDILSRFTHIGNTQEYYDEHYGVLLSQKSLNDRLRHLFPGTKNAPMFSTAFGLYTDKREVEAITWEPRAYGEHLSSDERVVIHGKQRLFNIFKGYPITPTETCTDVDIEPYLKLLKHLVKEEDYREAVDWFLMYSIAKPEVKCNWFVIHRGVSGAGKDLLLSSIAKILGAGEMYKTVGIDSLDSQFHDIFVATTFLQLNEGKLSPKLYAASKRFTASEAGDIKLYNPKYQRPTLQRDYINVYFTTEDFKAAKVEADDRRPMVIDSPHKLDNDQANEYIHWRDNGGVNYLFRRALNYDFSKYTPNIRPYKTVYFNAMLGNTRSDMEYMLLKWQDDGSHGFNYDFMSAELLHEVLFKENVDCGYNGLTNVKLWLSQNGYHTYNDIGGDAARPTKKIAGKKVYKSRSYLIKNDSRYEWHKKLHSVSEAFSAIEEIEYFLESLLTGRGNKKF